MNVYDNLTIVRLKAANLAILGLSDLFGRLQRWAGAPTLQACVESGTVGQGWPC